LSPQATKLDTRMRPTVGLATTRAGQPGTTFFRVG
jgi:hypothetical protein